MKKLELFESATGSGTAVISYDVVVDEPKAGPETGTQPAPPPGDAQPAGGSQAGGQVGAPGGLPPIIFDPGRGMSPAFHAPKRFGDWGELADEIQNIAEQARDFENRAVVQVNRNPTLHELHDVLARMPHDSDVLVVIG